MADFPAAPWQILNLDPATATDAAVKRAYAKLIKIHRPEADPDGFRRMHQAYQQALAQLRGEATASSRSALPVLEREESSPAGVDSGPALPAVCAALEVRLQAAVQAEDVNAIDDCLEEFRPLMKEDHTLWRPWGVILERSFVGKIPLLAKCLPPPGVVRLLEAGQAELAQAVLMAWHERGKGEEILKVARSLVTRSDLMTEAQVAVCVARLATLVSFASSDLGETLANLAFKHLPPGPTREWIMAQVEKRLSLGRIFAHLPVENARFREARLTVDPDPKQYDWGQRTAQREINFLCTHISPAWPGFGILQQFLPPEQWKRIELRLSQPRWDSDDPESEQRPRQRRTAQPYQSFNGERRRIGSPISIISLFILVITKLILALLNSK